MKGRASIPEGEDFAHLVFRVYGTFHSSLFRAVSPDPGLGRPGLEILGYLHGAGSSTITQTALACKMATSQLSLAVDRLVKAGLLERDRNGKDRRVAVIGLTKAGEAAFVRAYEGVRSRVEAFFAPLSSGQLDTLREAFGIVVALAQADNMPPVVTATKSGGPTPPARKPIKAAPSARKPGRAQ